MIILLWGIISNMVLHDEVPFLLCLWKLPALGSSQSTGQFLTVLLTYPPFEELLKKVLSHFKYSLANCKENLDCANNLF